MEFWILALLLFSFCAALKAFLVQKKRCLPPGPYAFPVVRNAVWLRRPLSEFESVLRELHSEYGPILTVHLGSVRVIFVSDRALTHTILVQNGALFADRPAPPAAFRPRKEHRIISTAPYGPWWRILRRNLANEVFHPTRVKQFSHAREWALGVLLEELHAEADAGETIAVSQKVQRALFRLMAVMCVGEKLPEEELRGLERALRQIFDYFEKLRVFQFAPSVTKYLFWRRWRRLMEMRQRQNEILLPLVRLRRQKNGEGPPSYVDSLLALVLPEENERKLEDEEIISLCIEFVNAGTETTTTALQWIMANVVKHQDVQARILEETSSVVGEAGRIEEDDLNKMPYLKAVIMEGLRRHPPVHFLLSHAAAEDFAIEGRVIPRGTAINFAVAEMGWDGRVWEDPMEFRPERFLPGGDGEGVDVTASRGIKMMPFGAGRRICPGLGLAMLHLQYFVASLVREFEWKTVEGEEVDLSEKQEFTTVMKHPLRARIFKRRGQAN